MMTSVWFAVLMDRWFTLMTNRSFKIALSKKNEDQCEEAVHVLRLVIQVFKNLDAKGSWHPPQTALIMTTEAFLDITEKLLEWGLDFVHSGRFLQDFIENIFPMMRLQCPKPIALLFKYRLKQLTISQFLKIVRNASYDPDGRTDAVDLTSLYEVVATKAPKEPEEKENVNELPANWQTQPI